VVLVHPEIPPNTGSIGRLCAATRTPLQLIEPLGFSLEDRYLRRAGLDYWPHLSLATHSSWQTYRAAAGERPRLCFSARATKTYLTAPYEELEAFDLVFGCETRGLPQEVVAEAGDALYRIPIAHPAVRSLNLANAVAIVLYEALRRRGALA
jgi:tRNA (cytidine/uridine-2'-O-)-methyltransferase